MEYHQHEKYLEGAKAGPDHTTTQSALNELAERIECLHSLGGRLEQRLASVLTPQSAEDSSERLLENVPPEAPLVGEITQLSRSASVLERYLERIIERLAV